MKRMTLVVALITFYSTGLFAQFMETGVQPSYAADESLTEWKKVEFTMDGQNLSYEYRIIWIKRKALACSYELQVKNTSSVKMKFNVKTHYYDRLVKGDFGDEYKETIKAGDDLTFIILTQGCQADKENKDQPDNERCKSCGLTYEIYTELD